MVLSRAAIDVRERLLKLLLYVSREHDPSPKVYRAAVEALLPLFSTAEGQQVFVQLAREYYYFWIQDPTAEARIGEAAPIGRTAGLSSDPLAFANCYAILRGGVVVGIAVLQSPLEASQRNGKPLRFRAPADAFFPDVMR